MKKNCADRYYMKLYNDVNSTTHEARNQDRPANGQIDAILKEPEKRAVPIGSDHGDMLNAAESAKAQRFQD